MYINTSKETLSMLVTSIQLAILLKPQKLHLATSVRPTLMVLHKLYKLQLLALRTNRPCYFFHFSIFSYQKLCCICPLNGNVAKCSNDGGVRNGSIGKQEKNLWLKLELEHEIAAPRAGCMCVCVCEGKCWLTICMLHQHI